MERFAALLRERPADVDFSLFENSQEKVFVKSYYDKYGELPPVEVFEKEFEVELPTEIAPWSFYEAKLREDRFIAQALPALNRFNENYGQDQKKALMDLKTSLSNLMEPDKVAKPMSVIKDLSRYEHFKDVTNARILTGIKPLDDACGGISIKDEFMIISARLGIGKSWIAHFVATSMALNGYKVGIYSGEMSEDEVGARVDSLISHLSNFALTRGKEVDLTEHMQKLSEVPGDILVLTSTELRHNARPSDIRKFIKDYELDCVILDQLDLMDPDSMRGGADFERKAELSFQLKTLQQEVSRPVIAVSQLGRAAAQQEADASHLAGSDRIGRDATLILALARKDDTLKIKVLKARSFKVPEQPWEFTWDIDKGILEPKLSAMDAVVAKVKQAKARQKVEDDNEAQSPFASAEDDEIW